MKDTTTEVVKLAPPLSVGGMNILSIPLNEWVIIATLVYTGMLITDRLFPGVIAKVAKWLLYRVTGIRYE